MNWKITVDISIFEPNFIHYFSLNLFVYIITLLGFSTSSVHVSNRPKNVTVEAEHIMTHEADSLEWPCGLPTPSSIDLGRLDVEEKKKIHPPML